MTSKSKFLDFEWLDNLFEAMFNLAYSLAMTPYKVVYNEKQGTYTVVSGSARKYFSLFVTVITAIVSYNRTYSAFAQVSLRTPAIIFGVAPEIGDIYLCFTIWYVVWNRKNEVCRFWSLMSLQTYKLWRSNEPLRNLKIGDGDIYSLPKHNFAKSQKHSPSKRSFIIPMSSCAIILLMISILDLLKAFGGAYAFYSNDTFGMILDEMKDGFFITRDKELKDVEDLTVSNYLVILIFIVFTCYMKLLKAFAILLAIAGVAVIFKNSYDLEKFLKTETDQLNVIQAFQLYRDFLEAINEIIGPIMFGIAIVCAPTFYVANLASILVSWNIYRSPITWLTMIVYAVVLIGAAEVTNKTDEFREWILDSGEGEYEHQLFGMFVDLTQNPVGVRGMQCFTVTYSFLAQIFSAVVTFTIILLQFQSEND
ncbi:unnamed protein product [Orchesella dallaii]|uniref:Gustatory receptor n=1 Tax=Orchesella dallaii TaxID=48710 RepID=A0ABP1S397_9HEXA